MNYLASILILIIPFCASSQKVVIKPDWKPGNAYRFKLTYTIDAPGLETTDLTRSTVYIYNSLRIINETKERWLLALQYDSIQLNEFKLDYTAKRRLGKAMKSYNMDLSKDSSEIAIENFDRIIVEFLDILTVKSRDEKTKKMKAEMLELGGFKYLLDSDYDFLFKNYLKAFSLNEMITKDSLDTNWKWESKETLKTTGTNRLEYALSERYEKFAKRDTIKNYVTIWNPVYITVDQSIEFNEKHIPVMSYKVVVTEDHGLEYYNTDSGFERKLGKGTITETIKVELIN